MSQQSCPETDVGARIKSSSAEPLPYIINRIQVLVNRQGMLYSLNEVSFGQHSLSAPMNGIWHRQHRYFAVAPMTLAWLVPDDFLEILALR